MWSQKVEAERQGDNREDPGKIEQLIDGDVEPVAAGLAKQMKKMKTMSVPTTSVSELLMV